MLRRIVLLALRALVALVFFSGAPLLAQQQTEPRIAFVVGNAGYGAGALPTALNGRRTGRRGAAQHWL